MGRWLDDEIQTDGIVVRRHRAEVLGTKAEFPTKRLAQRELDRRLSTVNSPTYRARPTATFKDFAERWKAQVMIHHSLSTQSSEKSELKAWVASFGEVPMKDINAEMLQSIVTYWSRPGKRKCSGKTTHNRVATFRLLWTSAKAWQYVAHDPFQGLAMPSAKSEDEQPSFNTEDVKRIINVATPPYDVVFWTVAETGIRRGEVCALDVGHVDLKNRIITVRFSRWNSHITSTKSDKPRVFCLSPQLIERLRFYVESRNADEPLFLTKRGKRLHPDNFVKRQLKPILKKLGLDGGLHAFRHGNATLLDSLHAPMKVRQERLGHASAETTMGYTHLISEDDRKIAAELGGLFAQVCSSPGKTRTA